MIAIHFEEHATCLRLLNKLKTYMNLYAAYGLGGTVTKCADRDVIEVDDIHDDVRFYESFQPLFVSILVEEVIEAKEDEWLMDITESVFYFTDVEEKRQIVAIAHAILQGERTDIPGCDLGLKRRECLYEAFSTYIDHHTSFYYEAFLTFRLKKYGDILIDTIGRAIDEYFLEQDYQAMIESCRHYLKQTVPKRPLIYMVHDEKMTFYDEQGESLTDEKLHNEVIPALVFEGDLDEKERVISPLVSMAPARVHVFSDEPDHSVIVTIQAIFQERLTIAPHAIYIEKVKK